MSPDDDVLQEIEGSPTRIGSKLSIPIYRLEKSHHPRVQEIIRRLKRFGGEVRIITTLDTQTRNTTRGGSYFVYDEKEHIPIIALDPFASLHELEHEMTHFEDWVNDYKRLKRRIKNPFDLESELVHHWADPRLVHETETHAIQEELRSLVKESKALGKPKVHSHDRPIAAIPALDLPSFIRNITYPDTQALVELMKNGLESLSISDRRYADELMDSALRKAYLLRKAAANRAVNAAKELPQDDPERKKLRSFTVQMQDASTLFDQIFSGQLPRFEQYGQVEPLRELYQRRLKKLLQ